MDHSQKHWLELAEQLGLPPEPAANSPEASAIAPSALVRHSVEPKRPPVKEVLAQPFGEPSPAPVAFEQITEPPAAGEPPAAHEPVGNLDQEHGPPQGRRRSHRGRRRIEPIAEGAEQDDAANNDTPASRGVIADGSGEDESPSRDRARRRGRGRARRKKEDDEPAAPLAVMDEDSAPTGETIQAADDEAEDDTDDISGWTIPSWQELIDSLYRPDR
jgi:hypothetical protein